MNNVLRVQRRRGVHHDHNDLRCRDGFQRGSLPLALRKHAFDAGQSFFGVVRLNHVVPLRKRAGGTISEHRWRQDGMLFRFEQVLASTYAVLRQARFYRVSGSRRYSLALSAREDLRRRIFPTLLETRAGS